MKRSRRKSFLIDVRQSTHCAAITNSQEILVVRMFSIVGQDRNRIQPRSVMVQLPLDPSDLAAVEKVPITTCVAVVSPVRQRRHVTDNRVERYEGLVVVTKVFTPRVDLLLARRIPRHLTAERVRILFPTIRAFLH